MMVVRMVSVVYGTEGSCCNFFRCELASDLWLPFTKRLARLFVSTLLSDILPL